MISKTHTKSGWIIDRVKEKVLDKVEEDKPVKKKKKEGDVDDSRL